MELYGIWIDLLHLCQASKESFMRIRHDNTMQYSKAVIIIIINEIYGLKDEQSCFENIVDQGSFFLDKTKDFFFFRRN